MHTHLLIRPIGNHHPISTSFWETISQIPVISCDKMWDIKMNIWYIIWENVLKASQDTIWQWFTFWKIANLREETHLSDKESRGNSLWSVFSYWTFNKSNGGSQAHVEVLLCKAQYQLSSSNRKKGLHLCWHNVMTTEFHTMNTVWCTGKVAYKSYYLTSIGASLWECPVLQWSISRDINL